VDGLTAMRVVAAGAGWTWIRSGFALFRAQPVVWVALAFAYWSIMSLVAMVPFVGFGASLVLVPIFSVSFMNIARVASRGQRPEFQMLASGFRERPKPLVVLGVIYLVLHLVLFAVLLAVSPLGDELPDIRQLGENSPEAAALEAALFRAMLLGAALYVPIVAAFWYAPVLTAWHGQPAGKSLFFSFFAVLANWRAFLIYGIAATTLAALLLGVAIMLMSGFAAGRGGGAEAVRLALPFYVATLMPVLFASFYASYRDVFPVDEEAPKPLFEQGHQ
jgi:hypothetical protein